MGTSAVYRYYESFESRAGYALFLGNTRHYGWYASAESWPFPIGKALRAMEDQLYKALSLPTGSRVLDAGCGSGFVAAYMARKGLQVTAIDVFKTHVEQARRNIAEAGLTPLVDVSKLDYHHLSTVADASMDGVYTMETLVHATDSAQVLGEFLRVLKPGGVAVFHEYDHLDQRAMSADSYFDKAFDKINTFAAMPANKKFVRGVLPQELRDTGFRDVTLTDLTPNVTPMLWLFFVIAFIPCLFIRALGLQSYFVNTLAGVEGYRARHLWRYTQVVARKPIA